MASASLLQVFDFEGKSGPIFAYATFDDGNAMLVTGAEGLVLSVDPDYEDNIDVGVDGPGPCITDPRLDRHEPHRKA